MRDEPMRSTSVVVLLISYLVRACAERVTGWFLAMIEAMSASAYGGHADHWGLSAQQQASVLVVVVAGDS